MLVTCSIKRRTLPFTMSKPKMRRQIFVHVLFAWLLLAASAFNHVTANVQAVQSGGISNYLAKHFSYIVFYS